MGAQGDRVKAAEPPQDLRVASGPFLRGLFVDEDLEVVDVADFRPGVDVDEDGFHRSLFSFRFPH